MNKLFVYYEQFFREDFNQIFDLMLNHVTSLEDTSSESLNGLELLILDTMLKPKRWLSPRTNLHVIDKF